MASAKPIVLRGLDVFEGEPEVPAALHAAPRCTLLPHVGSATIRAREAKATLVAENVISALQAVEPPNPVGRSAARPHVFVIRTENSAR